MSNRSKPQQITFSPAAVALIATCLLIKTNRRRREGGDRGNVLLRRRYFYQRCANSKSYEFCTYPPSPKVSALITPREPSVFLPVVVVWGGGVLLWKCRIQHFHYLHISAFYGETFHSLSLCAFQHSQYARPQGSSSSQRSSASIIKCNLLHQGQLFKYSFISFYIYIALYTTFTITGVTNKLKPVMDNRKGLRENRAVKDRSRVIGGQLNGGRRGS